MTSMSTTAIGAMPRERWARIKALRVVPRMFHLSARLISVKNADGVVINTVARGTTFKRKDDRAFLRSLRRRGLVSARQMRKQHKAIKREHKAPGVVVPFV